MERQTYSRLNRTGRRECAFHFPEICLSDSFDPAHPEWPNLEKLTEIPLVRIDLGQSESLDLYLCEPCLKSAAADWDEVEAIS